MKVGYARVSSVEQSLDVQLARLHDCERIYQEKQTGRTDQRPELQKCLDWVRAGDILIVTKLDRLARSVQHLTAIARTLEEKGVELQVLDQAMDTATPEGRLLFHTLGAIAEFENDLRRARQREGIEHARSQGRPLGPVHRLKPADIATLRSQRQQGMLIKDLMRHYGLSKASVYCYLAGTQPEMVQEMPAGYVHQNGVVVE